MKIVRSEAQIARVEEWAGRDLGDRGRYTERDHEYEQGIIDLLEWLRGETNYAPDGVEEEN